jgi:hypothetical protein
MSNRDVFKHFYYLGSFLLRKKNFVQSTKAPGASPQNSSHSEEVPFCYAKRTSCQLSLIAAIPGIARKCKARRFLGLRPRTPHTVRRFNSFYVQNFFCVYISIIFLFS